jgi:hypothetical protein
VTDRTAGAKLARRVDFRAVSEEKHRFDSTERERAATRRDVDAGIRDRMADEDMPDSERDARAHAARDRMAAMQDRQAAARERADADGRRRPPEAADDAPGEASA